MSNPYSAFRHPIRFASTLLTDWRPLDDPSVAEQSAAIERTCQRIAAFPAGRRRDLVVSHTAAAIAAAHARLGKLEDRREKLTSFAAVMLGATLSAARLLEIGSSLAITCSAGSFVVALCVLVLARRAIRMPSMPDSVEYASKLSTANDDHADLYHAANAQKFINASDVVANAWGAHLDFALTFIAIGTVLLLPAAL